MSDELVPLGEVLDRLEDGDRQLRDEAKQVADEVVLREQPMYVLDAERLMLACVLLDPERTFLVVEDTGLTAEDFYAERHRLIYEAMVDLRDADRHVETITVCDALNRKAQLDNVGGPSTIGQLESLLPSAHAASTYASMIIEKAKLRLFARANAEALHRARHGHRVEELASDLEASIDRAQRHRGAATFADLGMVIAKAEQEMPCFGAQPRGIPTGFVDIDRVHRLVPGDFVVVAARPSMGKSQWVTDVVADVTVRRKEPAAFFSLEMPSEMVITRLAGSHSGRDSTLVQMHAHDRGELVASLAEIRESPLHLDDTPGLTVHDIRARARSAHRHTPLRLVVVDYLQLIETPGDTDNIAQALGRVSRSLKNLARELECTVIAVSQLNRGVESRSDKRPMMSDIRESGAIEQDADVIAFLYREEYYARDRTPDELRGIAEYIVAKHRNGPTGMARLRFETRIPRFTSLAEEW